MTSKKKAALITAALATTLVLAGCSSRTGSGGVPGTEMPSGSMPGMEMSSSAPSTATSATFNDADVTFAQMMIVHHMQAISMSDTVLAKTGVRSEVRDLATKIKSAQSPEIDQMNELLTSWGKQKVTSSNMSGMSMGGGMSQSDMAELEKASGSQASTLFLTQMIQHHTSAVTMAKDEVQNGKNPQAVALAKKIVTDQTAEIATMKALLQQG